MGYQEFVEEHRDYAKDLYRAVHEKDLQLVKTREHSYFNAGTMERGADNPVSGNIVLADGYEFQAAFDKYKTDFPQMTESEARARVVFDFIQANGAPFNYEEHGSDILFGTVRRKDFYHQAIYENAIGNTNYFSRHLGDMQMICLCPLGDGKFPSSLIGISQQLKAEFEKMGTPKAQEIFLKRGLYHEVIHTVMGTADERKCDAFALLKLMKEYPHEALTIYAAYNFARSKTGYVIVNINQTRGNETAFTRAIKNGTMTYLMPHTYEKLQHYAQNPDKIPAEDTALIELTYQLTQDYEFSDNALQQFKSLATQPTISPRELMKSEIFQTCFRQSQAKDFEAYLSNDARLNQFIKQQADNSKKESDFMRQQKLSGRSY